MASIISHFTKTSQIRIYPMKTGIFIIKYYASNTLNTRTFHNSSFRDLALLDERTGTS